MGEDTIQHLFIDCSFSRRVLSIFSDLYGIPSFQNIIVRSFLEQWFKSIPSSSVFSYFPLFFFWSIWKQRNCCIFDNKQPSVYSILQQIEARMHLYPVPQKKKKIRCIGLGPQLLYPCGFFDGAATRNLGGAGFVLHLSASYSINFTLGCGRSTNTRSELLALLALLVVTKHLGIPLLTIFGDSLVNNSWAKRTASRNSPNLSHWCEDIRTLLQIVPPLTIKHIYHEHNQQADSLSKKAFNVGSWFWEFY